MDSSSAGTNAVNLGLDSRYFAGRMKRSEDDQPKKDDRIARVDFSNVYLPRRTETRARTNPSASLPTIERPAQAQAIHQANMVTKPTPSPASLSLPDESHAVAQSEPVVKTPAVPVVATETPLAIVSSAMAPVGRVTSEPKTSLYKQVSVNSGALKSKLRSFEKVAIEAVAILLLISVGIPIYSSFHKDTGRAQAVDANVETQLSYSVYTPSSPNFTLKKETLDYNTRTSAFSYAVNRKVDRMTIHVNESPNSPENTKGFSGLLAGSSLDTKVISRNGVISINKGAKFKNGQATTFKINSTLFFVRTEAPMKISEWQELIDSMTATKY